MEFLKKTVVAIIVVVMGLSLGYVSAMQGPASRTRSKTNVQPGNQQPVIQPDQSDSDSDIDFALSSQDGSSSDDSSDLSSDNLSDEIGLLSANNDEKLLDLLAGLQEITKQVLAQGKAPVKAEEKEKEQPGLATRLWDCVPSTSPGVARVSATIALPWILDQASGLCLTQLSAHCPHEGFRQAILVGLSLYGIYSAAHLTKYVKKSLVD